MQIYKRGLLFVTATAIISGFSIFLNKYGVSSIEATLFAGLKNIIVGGLFIFILFFTKEWRLVRYFSISQWWRLILVGLIGGSIPFILFFKGLQITNSLNAGFIHKTLFIYVSVLAFIFLKEKINKQSLLGVIFMLFGLILFTQVKPFVFNQGDWLVLLATLFWSAEIILVKRLLGDLPANLVIFARMFLGGSLIWFYLWWQGEYQQVLTLDLDAWRWVVVTSLLLFGYVFTFYHGLKKIPAHVATGVLTIGAPITALLNFGFFQKPLISGQILGILVIALSFFLLSRKKQFWFLYERH